MTSSSVAEKYWGVFYGGLVALKYLLPLNLFLIFTHYPDKIFQTLKACLIHSNDDVSGAASSVLHSFSLGVKRTFEFLKLDPLKIIKFTEFREKFLVLISEYLTFLIEDLRTSINSLDALSCRCYSLCNGLSSCCLLLLHCIPNCSPSSPSSSSSTSYTPSQSSHNTIDHNNRSNDQSYHLHNNKIDDNVNNEGENNANDVHISKSRKKTRILTSETILDVTVVLTSALSDILLKLMLFCRRTQTRCLLALKPC